MTQTGLEIGSDSKYYPASMKSCSLYRQIIQFGDIFTRKNSQHRLKTYSVYHYESPNWVIEWIQFPRQEFLWLNG